MVDTSKQAVARLLKEMDQHDGTAAGRVEAVFLAIGKMITIIDHLREDRDAAIDHVVKLRETMLAQRDELNEMLDSWEQE